MSDDRDELRFAKTQQWYVAAAAVSLYAGAYAVLKAAHLRCYEVGLVSVFLAAVATGRHCYPLAASKSHARSKAEHT